MTKQLVSTTGSAGVLLAVQIMATIIANAEEPVAAFAQIDTAELNSTLSTYFLCYSIFL